jgi:hypothetical protein
MALPNIFTRSESEAIIARINKLSPNTSALWGKMNASQMLAHCNVTYEMVYDNIHKEPNFFVKLLLNAFVKKSVVNEVPYSKNSQTAPAFQIKEEKNFEAEKKRLIAYITKTSELGESHFENKKSLSFGVLTKSEWNNMFWKHLNHHLSQFGV